MENKKKHNEYVHFKFFLSIMIALPVLSVSIWGFPKFLGNSLYVFDSNLSKDAELQSKEVYNLVKYLRRSFFQKLLTACLGWLTKFWMRLLAKNLLKLNFTFWLVFLECLKFPGITEPGCFYRVCSCLIKIYICNIFIC